MKIIACLLFLLVPTSLFAAPVTFEQLSDSVCRVYAANPLQSGYGTGTVFSQDDDNYYVLTNGHVVTQKNMFSVQFIKDGQFLTPIKANLKWAHYVYNTTIDVAILSVNKGMLHAGLVPRVIPLANYETPVRAGDMVFGGGFPASRWLQFWNTKIMANNGNVYHIHMPPEGGQSGTAMLMNINDETYIVGIVSWRYGDDAAHEYGGAVSLLRIYDIFTRKAAIDRIDVKYPIPVSHNDEICNGCGKTKDEHVLIYDKNTNEPIMKNGKPILHCPGHQIVLEPGQGAVEWKIRPVPPGIKPRNPGLPPGQGPIGELPPGLLQPPQPPPAPTPVPDNSEEIRELKTKLEKSQAEIIEHGKTIESLQDTVSQLMKENQKLSQDLAGCHKNDIAHSEQYSKLIGEKNQKIADLEAKIKIADVPNSGLESQVQLWKDEVAKLKQEIVQHTHEVLSKDKEISLLKSKIDELNKEIERLKAGKTVLEGDLKRLSEANSDLSTKNKDSKSQIDDMMGEIEKLKEGIEPDSLDNPVTDGKTTKMVLALILGFLLSRLAPFIKAKFGVVIGSIIVKALEKGGQKVLSVPAQAPAVEKKVEHVVTPVSTDAVPPPTSSSIRQFIQMKQKDGEDINKLAIFGILYREAVEKLKAGYFHTDSGVPVLSQEKVAKKIEEWVIEEFFKTTTIDQIKTHDDLHREAMYGFLYQQAFAVLRQGKLGNGVLNHVEIAEAVDKWVKREYLSRINVRM